MAEQLESLFTKREIIIMKNVEYIIGNERQTDEQYKEDF